MIEILKTGMYDSIQDFGRMGYQEFGVPMSGVMDRYSATLANSILGNPSHTAVLESTIVGPHLKFNHETAICISGADMNAKLNDLELRTNAVYRVKQGDVLKLGKCNYGCRGYLAVLGGFQTEEQIGSLSMYKGITANYRLVKGDVLPILKTSNYAGNSFSSIKIDKNHFEDYELEVFNGPEFEKLDDNQQQKLFNTAFSISKDSNRMAYQFNEPLENSLQPIITSLVLPGTIQLTPSGQLIVLMRDCQTTGGYPRVLQLTENAINRLSQRVFGSKITFKRFK
jgi:biotin-dependent carboxylase-like uncharacterized protein